MSFLAKIVQALDLAFFPAAGEEGCRHADCRVVERTLRGELASSCSTPNPPPRHTPCRPVFVRLRTSSRFWTSAWRRIEIVGVHGIGTCTNHWYYIRYLPVLAVLDTCILVPGLRSKLGASHAVLQAIYARRVRVALSVTLAMEYEAVCVRPGLVPALTPSQIRTVIDVLCALSVQQKVFYTWRPHLPDPDDDHVLELALAAGAPYIITQNHMDFRGSDSLGVQTISAARALTLI